MPGRKEKIRFLSRIPKDPSPAEWGYFLSFVNPSRINASVEIAVLPADLNDFPGLIRTMDARNLPVSP